MVQSFQTGNAERRTRSQEITYGEDFFNIQSAFRVPNSELGACSNALCFAAHPVLVLFRGLGSKTNPSKQDPEEPKLCGQFG
jgi:hypothetical protein